MTVLAANVTDETIGLITENLVKSKEFVKLSLQQKLDFEDKTVLIRLALINLLKNKPNADEIESYKAALLRPQEFDIYWKRQLEAPIVQ